MGRSRPSADRIDAIDIVHGIAWYGVMAIDVLDAGTHRYADGTVTPAARAKLRGEERRTSRAIYRKKHNGRVAAAPVS